MVKLGKYKDIIRFYRTCRCTHRSYRCQFVKRECPHCKTFEYHHWEHRLIKCIWIRAKSGQKTNHQLIQEEWEKDNWTSKCSGNGNTSQHHLEKHLYLSYCLHIHHGCFGKWKFLCFNGRAMPFIIYKYKTATIVLFTKMHLRLSWAPCPNVNFSRARKQANHK